MTRTSRRGESPASQILVALNPNGGRFALTPRHHRNSFLRSPVRQGYPSTVETLRLRFTTPAAAGFLPCSQNSVKGPGVKGERPAAWKASGNKSPSVHPIPMSRTVPQLRHPFPFSGRGRGIGSNPLETRHGPVILRVLLCCDEGPPGAPGFTAPRSSIAQSRFAVTSPCQTALT